ncbi:MAG: hypothetical protein C0399_06855 [Syntrophus sp. (in: bacteria)]|nr:hypothetical protein [Syntrophus sp. (in: bacteria)]
MKKLIVLFVCLTIFGCATTKQQPLYSPTNFQSKTAAVAYGMIDITQPIKSYRYIITDGKVPNAWIIPASRTVYITAPLLDLLTAAEVAAVLLHENAHIILNHSRKRATASVVTTAAFVVGNVFVPGVGLINHLANPLVTNSFSRPQEMDADKMAMELARSSGIDPQVYISALEKLRNHPSAKDNAGGGLFDSHPNLEYRIEQAKKEIDKTANENLP